VLSDGLHRPHAVRHEMHSLINNSLLFRTPQAWPQ